PAAALGSVVTSGRSTEATRSGRSEMTTAHAEAQTDDAGVARLSQRFADVLFDLNMPVWRFQLQGPREFGAQLAAIARGEVRIEVLRTVPTRRGFVTEHVEHQDVDGEELSARRLWLCELRDGRIAEAVGYCSGEWDAALRARHAREAPMLRW